MELLRLTAVFSGMYFVPVFGGAENSWTYNGVLGSSHWHVDFPACGGNRQSPINIDLSKVIVNQSLSSFDLTDLHKIEGIEMKMENVLGHTVEVDVSGASQYVFGGGLQGRYKVEQFHFHWGSIDARGSEHSINSRLHPGEMHIVLFSVNYPDIKTALTKQDGVAVLGFFFKIGEHNTHFDYILSHFVNISHSGKTQELEAFSIRTLLPPWPKTFYRYVGSLTTPPCSETVVWTLFKEEIEISEQQLEKFRHIKRNKLGEIDEDLTDDFRPLQRLYGRKITTNNLAGLTESVTGHACQCATHLLLIVFAFCLLQMI
ncbi:carbonic anhydrase 2-like isoform X2 [Gigantopelta aegis]|uniref:carbonic anhydrase 2-like isoform X2 n=1 Tax=Gigantopelta aegis TaxID=1735272 RepID=UPI001B888D2D|nr:carbonic anhydrase 2-like isoform X2 [Gigantopelta aegis]